ncbi:MBL fold metallo-hydrolase [Iamia sp. SCSIO 61187]|uniref:MBL fold metallo-hydrolase n=1 Tax=Iamia sp. SCSIO 61187 TaxID=2722752 RepID=UPI001C62F3E5|nr:MBL fold metallo-hydrolase [Iamia sp. SCSIO 61187]QYG91956.1 MBL fold metallo-hydrolase [Iamia sp. SCSIO 61187]
MTHPRTLPVAPDVWLVRSSVDAEAAALPLSSLVVTGADPVLVDTGDGRDRDAWWAQVEAVVDPREVRWVVLSHDDPAHCGALPDVLARCPDATVVASWAMAERLAARAPGVARTRVRWVAEGDVVPGGGRELCVLRPPAYDSPATLGLLDAATGVFWSSVCFGTPVPHDVEEVSVLDRDVWEDGLARYHLRLSPWIADVDPARWRAAVSRVAVHGPRTIASARGPLIRRGDVGRALDMLIDLAGLPEPAPDRPGGV